MNNVKYLFQPSVVRENRYFTLFTPYNSFIMKLIFLAQTALCLTLEEVFKINFGGTEYTSHGCHCARLSGELKSSMNSNPASALDSHCYDWQRSRNCAKFSSVCLNADDDYDLEVSCDNQTNDCRKLVCRVDYVFLHKIDNQEVDFNEETECSFDFKVPQDNPNKSCCLNGRFDAQFYNSSEKTCIDGNIKPKEENDSIDEPLPFTQDELDRVVSELENISNLPFTVTNTWRGPNVENLNTLNGVFYKSQPGQKRKRRSTNVRMARNKRSFPDAFDLRNDLKCGNVAATIRDQGPCASDYAQAVASVASHALCKATNGASQHRLSAMDIMNCGSNILRENTNACSGGDPANAMLHFKNEGLVTGYSLVNKLDGLDYDVGCFPYRSFPFDSLDKKYVSYIPEDNHDIVIDTTCSTCQCPANCYYDYPTMMDVKPFFQDKKGSTDHIEIVEYNLDVAGAMQHIIDHGAVLAVFKVNPQIYAYDGGVFEFDQDDSQFLGRRAVTIVGWGTDKASGIDYCTV